MEGRVENDGWRVAGGSGWMLVSSDEVEGGRWEVEGGGWRVMDGAKTLEGERLCREKWVEGDEDGGGWRV